MKASTFQTLILGFLCLAAAALAGALYNQQQRIAELQSAAAKPTRHLQSLQQDSSRLREAQEALRQEMDELRLALDNGARQTDTLAPLQDQWAQEIQALRDELSTRSSETELATLRERLEQTEQKLQALEAKRLSTAPPYGHARKAVRPPAPAPVSPPFTVLGSESRGAERFLVLAPLGSRSLAEVQLLRRGERIGSWHLKTLGYGAAIFTVPERPDQIIQLP